MHSLKRVMRRWILAIVVFAVVFGGAGLLLRAHPFYSTNITWSRDVSRVVYNKCASCHREGGPAVSLMTYQEARPWAEAIKQQVLARRMPPWNAVQGFGEFKNDHGLTQEDMEIIAEWVEGGAPQGNPLYLPPKPQFSSLETKSSVGAKRLTVSGTTVMQRPVEAIGIEPTQIPADGVLQVIARRPDESVEPLLWIERFNPHFNTTYYFRNPLQFPAGTKIEIMPRSGSVALVLKAGGQRGQAQARRSQFKD
jgi:hypothetical protein